MLELHSLCRTFGSVSVVKNVSLQIESGELLVLLGGSGFGKTTTLKMVNRLVLPTSGHVTMKGQDVSHLPAHELRRRIGYVFQGIGLFPHLSVGENIAITPSLLGWTAQRMRHRVEELLEMVELESGITSRKPSELSGGQQQRVAVARALAAEPEVVLFDEPFGALDALTRERLQRNLKALQNRLKFTSIFVTHDVVEAMILGDRVGVMREGKLLQLATGREMYREPSEAYVSELVRGPIQQARRIEALFEREEG